MTSTASRRLPRPDADHISLTVVWAKGLRRVGREADGGGAGFVVGDDVDDGRLARGEGAFQGRADVVRLLDVLPGGAEVDAPAVAAGVAKVAAGLRQRPRPRRIGRPGPAVS